MIENQHLTMSLEKLSPSQSKGTALLAAPAFQP
jgi:hypothetical protein